MAQGIPARLTIAEARRFGFTLGTAFAVLAAFLWWRGRTTAPIVIAVLAAALYVLALSAPAALRPVYRAWMGFALALSKVTTPIFMTVLFFVVITPVALVMRVFGHRPLTHRVRDGSYWIPRAPDARRSPLDRQF